MHPVHKAMGFVGAVLSVLGAAAVEAQGLHDFHRVCFEDLVLTEIPLLDDIPVGCEIVDCCPGCPGPPLDWVIRFEGELVEGLALRFEGLPVDPRQIAGEGARWDGERLIVAPDTTVTLRGLPARGDGRPPVALPELLVDRRQLAAYAEPAGGRPGERAAVAMRDAQVDLHVEQRIGRFTVNEHRARLIFFPCGSPFQDRIDLDNNENADRAVVLVDGRRAGGCVNDEVRRGEDVIAVGNLLSRGACRAETITFSDGDALQVREDVALWTDVAADLQEVDQSPNEPGAPLSVWLLRPDAGFTALFDVIRAGNLFEGSNCGSDFLIDRFEDRAENAAEVALVPGTSVCSAAGIAALTASAIFTPGQLNAYYVDGAFTAFNCINEPNISVVGTLANNQSLAHEFGHAYTLGHTNAIASIPATNVMFGGGAGRTDFTEGQCFRTNVNPTSKLNLNGVRSGPVRTCPDATTNGACPALDLDVDPD